VLDREEGQENMEGPLDTFENPKQDKMISLIAWLIIASLLFYLAVFTFESFLRKSPWFAVTQELSSTEAIEEVPSSVKAVGSQFIEPDIRESVADLAQLPVQDVTEAQVTVPTENSFDSLGSEVNPSEVEEIVAQTANITKQVEKTVAVEQLAQPVVEAALSSGFDEPLEMDKALSQLRLNAVFPTRKDAFQYLKVIDFGEMDLELELIRIDQSFHVLIGGLLAQSEMDRMQKYLTVRNHGLGLSRLSESDREEVLSSIKQVPADRSEPVNKASASAKVGPRQQVGDFDLRVSGKPFTIQVGSFLNRESATQVRDQMLNKGFTSKVEEKFQGGTYHYRVLVGNFFSRTDATDEATRLSEVEDVPVYVRKAPR
jgi:hypothetical protein